MQQFPLRVSKGSRIQWRNLGSLRAVVDLRTAAELLELRAADADLVNESNVPSGLLAAVALY